MAKKEFQAESKKLMDMMINSIYTNKEIFLRELISNASDAIDKLYYKSLTDTSVGMNKSDFRILITRDKENRILTVEDNGIGMTKAELEENLGTIAHSGSLDFKQDNKDENIDISPPVRIGTIQITITIHIQRQLHILCITWKPLAQINLIYRKRIVHCRSCQCTVIIHTWIHAVYHIIFMKIESIVHTSESSEDNSLITFGRN